MLLLAGTKRLMPTAFHDLCETMMTAADEGALPQTLQLNNIFGVTCQDIGDLCNDFEKETELKITAHIFYCRECDKTHAIFEVDYDEDEEDQKILLQ